MFKYHTINKLMVNSWQFVLKKNLKFEFFLYFCS